MIDIIVMFVIVTLNTHGRGKNHVGPDSRLDGRAPLAGVFPN